MAGFEEGLVFDDMVEQKQLLQQYLELELTDIDCFEALDLATCSNCRQYFEYWHWERPRWSPKNQGQVLAMSSAFLPICGEQYHRLGNMHAEISDAGCDRSIPCKETQHF